jgi:catechol 2,3-dioxygenase-like lactoylglutathione lyase family enzyme
MRQARKPAASSFGYFDKKDYNSDDTCPYHKANLAGGNMPIRRVATLCVFVRDQDRAKDFYTRKLGMQARTDQPLSPGAASRWVSVAPPGAETEIILYLLDQNWEHYKQVQGKSQALTLDVIDMASTAADLKNKGVKFVSEPDVQPWGTYATIEDSEGNQLLLVEQPTGMPER